jgi:hypothetical protein
MSKNVAVLIKDKERQYEGLRCSLGLLLEEHAVSMYILGNEIDVTEEFLDNMGFIDEMGGARYSDVAANVGKHGFHPVRLEDVPSKIRQSEVTIPF